MQLSAASCYISYVFYSPLPPVIYPMYLTLHCLLLFVCYFVCLCIGRDLNTDTELALLFRCIAVGVARLCESTPECIAAVATQAVV